MVVHIYETLCIYSIYIFLSILSFSSVFFILKNRDEAIKAVPGMELKQANV